jgi:lipopolysaccharide export system permease protein
MQSTEHDRRGISVHWWRPTMGIWDHIVREAAPPFLLALTVIMFVFLLQFLMRFIGEIAGKGLGIVTIVELIAYNLSWMVVLAVPMAVLVAGVMAFGSMAATNELTAMKAAGVSLGRMMFPLILLCVLIGVFDLQFNNIVLPDANHKAKDLMSDIRRKKPTLVVEPGRFTTEDEIPGYAILARRAIPQTSDLEDVTIYDHSQPGQTKVLTARFAHLAFTSDFRNIILTMREGEIHQQDAQQPAEYRRGRFGTYVVQMPASGYDFMHEGESERSGRELSATELLKRVYTRDTLIAKQRAQLREHLLDFAGQLTSDKIARGRLDSSATLEKMKSMFASRASILDNDVSMISSTQEDIDSYMVEVHKKYAIPSACIIFAFIGAPLGALAKRSGVGAGVGLSIGFFVLYWIFLIGGEKLADRGVITPFWGMWGGNLLLLAVGIWLTWRVAVESKPGKSTLFAKLRRQKRRSDPVST